MPVSKEADTYERGSSYIAIVICPTAMELKLIGHIRSI